ncbi:MAG: phenylalanine--tRNA ligase subunit beta [Candidatus Gracilibacteria bacterium]
MQLPLTWLQSYTPIDAIRQKKDNTTLAHEYSIHTAEIDGIHTTFSHHLVVVAKVLETRKHENSDRLNIVMVDAGTHGKRQIVCGAPNAPETKFAALALPGAVLGPDFTIAESTIRGELSQGMLCGADEIGLEGERSGGILQLEDIWSTTELESLIGVPFFSLSSTLLSSSDKPISVPMQETIFEIDNKFITNRPDLFGVEGNAREMSTLYDASFEPLKSIDRIGGGVEKSINIDAWAEKCIQTFTLNEYQIAHPVTNPGLIPILLHRLDERSNNFFADVSNLVMYETAAPMHIYDADKLVGVVSIRMAQEGELFEALNDKTYILKSTDLVIADEVGVICLAGVIGGKRTATHASTTHILVEAGCFDATTIRFTSARIGLRTAASMRFEKSQNPLGCERAIRRFEDYLKEYSESTRISQASFKPITPTVEIELTHKYIESCLGVDISKEQITSILQKLAFEVSESNESYHVRVPAHRATKDVSIPADIVEEVARMYGYENIPSTPIIRSNEIVVENKRVALIRSVRSFLVSQNLLECYNYSFSNQEDNEHVGIYDHTNSIALLNSTNEDHTHMRRHMLPWMLHTIKDNTKRAEVFGLFEIGRTHKKDDSGTMQDDERVIITTRGYSDTINKELLQRVCEFISGGTRIIPHDVTHFPAYHPGKLVIVPGKEEPLLIAGYIHPSTLRQYDLSNEYIFSIEIDLEEFHAIFTKTITYKSLSKFQSTNRELNFVTPERLSFAQLCKVVQSSSPLLQNILHVADYRDDAKLGTGNLSRTLSFDIVASDHTLTDDELSHIQEQIITNVESNTAARLRRE